MTASPVIMWDHDAGQTLSALFVWKSVCKLGYLPLESFLSTYEVSDEQIICADWSEDPELERLCNALSGKFSSVRVIPFEWPKSSPDGSAIGVATQYALDHAWGDYCVNVQADEVWPTPLMEYMRDRWRDRVRHAECLSFKVLNLEHNAQRFQGGEEWDGVKGGDVWNRGGMFNGKDRGGAGYNRAIKLFKNCKSCGRIRVANDGWSMDNCSSLHHLMFTEQFPIIHLHDMMRDHLIDIRRNAADRLWQDQSKFGFYRVSADNTESTKDMWWNDEIWTRKVSPFDMLLPEVVRPIIGKTRYEIRWELIQT